MGWDAPWHWIVLAVIVIALFGYKKLPDASRALGRSLRIFKTEIKGMGEDDKTREVAKSDVVDAAPAPQPEQKSAPTANGTTTNGTPPATPATNGTAPAAPAAAATPTSESAISRE